MREMATERGISLIEIGREAEHDGWIIDRMLDERQKHLGETEDNFIIDGRLAFHFSPQAVKIFLRVESSEAARRIFRDATRSSVETHIDLAEAAHNIEVRRESENTRYMQYYGIAIYDMSLYDIVIDTTNKSPEEVFDTVVWELEKYRNRSAPAWH